MSMPRACALLLIVLAGCSKKSPPTTPAPKPARQTPPRTNPAPAPVAQPRPPARDLEAERRQEFARIAAAEAERKAAAAKAAEALARERQERAGREFRLLPEYKKALVRSVMPKFADPKRLVPTAAEDRVLHEFWDVFFDTPTGRDALWVWVEKKHHFGEFCKNLGVPKGPSRRDLALTYFSSLPARGGALYMALTVSREIKQKGVDGLFPSHKEYVRQNQDLFAAVLKRP